MLLCSQEANEYAVSILSNAYQSPQWSRILGIEFLAVKADLLGQTASLSLT